MKQTIPTDADKFKVWADAACGAWPAKLQALAYAAWRELIKGETAKYNEFCKQFQAQG